MIMRFAPLKMQAPRNVRVPTNLFIWENKICMFLVDVHFW